MSKKSCFGLLWRRCRQGYQLRHHGSCSMWQLFSRFISGTSKQNSPLQGHSWCNQWRAKSLNQKGYFVVISNVGVHTFYQDVLIDYRPACGSVVHQTRSYDLKLHQTKAMEKEEALVKIIGLIWYVQLLVMDCCSWPSPPFMPQVSFVLRLQPL